MRCAVLSQSNHSSCDEMKEGGEKRMGGTRRKGEVWRKKIYINTSVHYQIGWGKDSLLLICQYGQQKKNKQFGCFQHWRTVETRGRRVCASQNQGIGQKKKNTARLLLLLNKKKADLIGFYGHKLVISFWSEENIAQLSLPRIHT